MTLSANSGLLNRNKWNRKLIASSARQPGAKVGLSSVTGENVPVNSRRKCRRRASRRHHNDETRPRAAEKPATFSPSTIAELAAETIVQAEPDDMILNAETARVIVDSTKIHEKVFEFRRPTVVVHPGKHRNFDPSKSTGLGMQIVQALVKEIGGELCFLTGANGRGTTVTLAFDLPNPESRLTRITH